MEGNGAGEIRPPRSPPILHLKVNRTQGNFLFRIVSKACERSSLIVTTNQDFSGWAEIFEDPIQVSAMLDRLLHHSVVFNIKGDSYRVRGKKAKGGGEK